SIFSFACYGMPSREVETCVRCRHSKRRCDKAKPKCGRGRQAGLPCHYDASQTLFTEELLSTSTESPHSTNNEPRTEKVVKKRNRACLSCIRCHRLKVKCDKRQPFCSRCARTGYGKTCEYTHRVQQTNQPSSPSFP